MRRELIRPLVIRPLVLGGGLFALLAPGAPARAIEWGNLFGGGSAKTEKPAAAQSEDIGCPDVQILDGTAGMRVPAGSSGAGVRHQFSIGEVARECGASGGLLTIKVGVEGNVLLGPAGAPGSFSAPLRVVIVDESTQKPISSKVYSVSAQIPAGAAQAGFSVVSEPLTAPLRADADTAYTVKVGFDARGGGGERKTRKRKRAAD